jgi:tRNA (guanine-N7-)-methyltransferase
LGLEVRKTAIEWIQTVLSGEGIHNAAAIWYSVANGLPFLENNSIEEIYYFFPDPWIKKRHHKRRAFTAELLQEFHRIIKPEGTLYLMTDVPEVDEYQLALLAETRLFDVTHIHTDDDWHLQIRTDQEMFSQRKNIPYVRRIAKPC